MSVTWSFWASERRAISDVAIDKWSHKNVGHSGHFELQNEWPFLNVWSFWSHLNNIQWAGRTGCWLQMSRLSLRNNRLKVKTLGKLPIILEEFIENMPQINKAKTERCQHVNRLDLGSAGISTDYAQNPPRTMTTSEVIYFKWASEWVTISGKSQAKAIEKWSHKNVGHSSHFEIPKKWPFLNLWSFLSHLNIDISEDTHFKRMRDYF